MSKHEPENWKNLRHPEAKATPEDEKKHAEWCRERRWAQEVGEQLVEMEKSDDEMTEEVRRAKEEIGLAVDRETYTSSRGGLYKEAMKKKHEELGGDDELVRRGVLIKKSADKCPVCGGKADHCPGGIHCRL